MTNPITFDEEQLPKNAERVVLLTNLQIYHLTRLIYIQIVAKTYKTEQNILEQNLLVAMFVEAPIQVQLQAVNDFIKTYNEDKPNCKCSIYNRYVCLKQLLEATLREHQIHDVQDQKVLVMKL